MYKFSLYRLKIEQRFNTPSPSLWPSPSLSQPNPSVNPDMGPPSEIWHPPTRGTRGSPEASLLATCWHVHWTSLYRPHRHCYLVWQHLLRLKQESMRMSKVHFLSSNTYSGLDFRNVLKFLNHSWNWKTFRCRTKYRTKLIAKRKSIAIHALKFTLFSLSCYANLDNISAFVHSAKQAIQWVQVSKTHWLFIRIKNYAIELCVF